ncbi:MAG: zincin-like metallopeptidase domain-containing protein [FCB group bacterium]|jgi:antirestriction protein ArdC
MLFIYQRITDLIIEKLRQGVVPWQKTWTTAYPKNFISGLEYKGINILLLGMQDYESNFWLTFKQCKDLGGSILIDEKASLVVFWKPIVNISGKELDEVPEAKINFLLRYYYVFNITQCYIPDEVLKKRIITRMNPKIIEAEQVIEKYHAPPEIIVNNLLLNPRYLPRLDKIEIQSIDNFFSSDDYYSSLFHELVHSTGAKHRLARRGVINEIQFGTENYSKEELIAEIGASYLCNISGIHKTISNQSAYIQNWLQVLHNDSRMILIAASQAQKACDYMINDSSTNTQKEV